MTAGPAQLGAEPTALRVFADLSGPRALPLVGSLWQIARGRLHQTLERWALDYGSVFKVTLGSRVLLVVADHEVIKSVLRNRPAGFRRGGHMERIGLEMGLKPGVFAANGEDWRRQRRMVMAGLDPKHIRVYFPALLSITQRLRARWVRAAQTVTPIAMQSDLMRFSVDVVTGLALGTDCNSLESDAEQLPLHLERITHAMFRRMMALIPTWRYWRLPSDRRLEESVAATNEAIAQFIAQARRRLDRDPRRRSRPPNLLEAMIVAADADPGGLTDQEIAGNAQQLMMAGEDTSANTLAWLIHLLYQHPAALKRAREEVQSAVSDSADLTLEQLGSFEFLDACIQETLRLKPAAPLQVCESLHDAVIADVQVPAGTTVLCLMRSDCLREQYFIDPLAFKPSRWLAGSGPRTAGGAARRVSTPFGFGPRTCPARTLALLEIKLVAAMLLTHFDITQVSGTAQGPKMERMSFTMIPLPLRMKLTLRA